MSSFADAEKDLADALRRSRIVELKSSSKLTMCEIARAVGVDVRTVYGVIKSEADKVRAETGDLVDSMFMAHQVRLERMWASAQARIDNMPSEAPSSEFCNAVRAAIMILERQARMLGLDRTAAHGGANKSDWLDAASEAELRDAAKRWGLVVPEPIA